MNNKLFVSNLTFETSTEEVKNLFEKFGPVANIKKIADKKSADRCLMFVDMESWQDAAYIVKKRHYLNERPVYVEEAKSNKNASRPDQRRSNFRNHRDGYGNKSGRPHFSREREVNGNVW